MADIKNIGRHTLTMEEREYVRITGIIDVISFDEDSIVADTARGVIILKGIDLHVNRLNLDIGELDVEGEVFNITYEDQGTFSKPKSSFFNRLFK